MHNAVQIVEEIRREESEPGIPGSAQKTIPAADNKEVDEIEFTAMNAFIHPPQNIHPFTRLIFSWRFVDQNLLRSYLDKLERIQTRDKIVRLNSREFSLRKRGC